MPRWAIQLRPIHAAIGPVLCTLMVSALHMSGVLHAAPALAANFDVTVANDDGTGGTSGTLSWAINQSNSAGGTNTITIAGSVGTINMSGALPMISSSATVVGNNTSIQGNNNRLFFVNSGTVAFQNLAVTGGRAQGGRGGDAGRSGGAGGGGLGAGGGLFVNAGASVTIENVSFSGNTATGGNGGSSDTSNMYATGSGGGGGGGFGGNGGKPINTGGAGGGGFLTAGGNGGTYGGGGGGGVSGNGGNGQFQTGGTGSGGTAGGGIGQPGANGTSGAPGGGGGGDGNGVGFGGAGATFGGGGGGGYFSAGGAGGDFGGGGGANYDSVGGAGGFGGGGGGGGWTEPGGTAGFGGGNGANGRPFNYENSNGGDGGSGFGGAIFVRDGGSLTVINSSAAADNQVNAGLGGTGSVNGSTGQARGSNLFLMSSVNAVFDGTGTTTFAGTIYGDGSVIKQGTGTLILSGANQYGHTQVNGGLLTVNGSILGDTTINLNGTLGGTGTINGSVQNHGTVAPGNSIGTLTASSNWTSNVGSTTRIEINDGGNIAGVNNDLLSVGGQVDILGGTVDVQAAPGTYTAGTEYTFLTSVGSITGAFDGVTDDLTGFYFQFLYDNHTVRLVLLSESTDYAAEAQTLNQFGAATYIDTNSADPALQNLINQMNSLSPDQLRQALDELTPESVGTIAQLGVQNSTIVCLQLSRQLRPPGSSGYGGGDEGGEGDTASTRKMSGEAATFVANFGREGAPMVVRGQDAGYGDWTSWATGYGMGGNAQSDGNAAGGDYGLSGVLIAVQRNIDDNHVLGIYGAYSGFSLTTDGPQQSQTANGGEMGGFYRGGDGFNYYLLSAGIGPDTYRSSLAVNIGNIQDVAEGSYGGWQSSMWLERGVTFEHAGWDIQPLGALNYVYLRQNGYTEHGASISNLQVDAVDTNALRGLLGGYVSRKLYLESGRVLTPEFRAFWVHEFLEPETTVDSTFTAVGGPSFAANGLNFGRDWAVIGLGGKYDLNSQLSLFGNYDLQINSRQTANYGSGGLQYSW